MSEFAMRMEKEKSSVDSAVQSAKQPVSRENRTGIPLQLKERMEQSTGLSFDDVRVHYNSALPARLDALAYTQGNQVEIGPGQERHLPHELGHVVQQKLGVVRANARHASGVMLNTDSGLEHQADEIGAGKCVQLKARQEQGSLTVQQNEGQDCEKVVQCRMDPNALIYDILQIILEAPDNLQGLLAVLRPGTDVKTIKENVDIYAEFLGSKLDDIYQLFFDHYGIKVDHGGQGLLSAYGFSEEEIDYNDIIREDKSSLIDELNDLNSTKTGADLLTRIADNAESDERLGVLISIGLGEEGQPGTESTSMFDEYLIGDWKSRQGNWQSKFEPNKGAGTKIMLHSETLMKHKNPDYFNKDNDQRAVLAHELIHALHAQMGIKPDWRMLLDWQVHLNSAEYARKLPYQMDDFFKIYPEFENASPDDVLVTGIRNDLKYPDPIAEVQHITENQIREELSLGKRTSYLPKKEDKKPETN